VKRNKKRKSNLFLNKPTPFFSIKKRVKRKPRTIKKIKVYFQKNDIISPFFERFLELATFFKCKMGKK
jgi:hypothetical protein